MEKQRDTEGAQADGAVGPDPDAGAGQAEDHEHGKGQQLNGVRPHEPPDLRGLPGAEDHERGRTGEDGDGRQGPGAQQATRQARQDHRGAVYGQRQTRELVQQAGTQHQRRIPEPQPAARAAAVNIR
ncbi:hypothetical protein ACFVJH_26620 [Streptomyces decoyicus]|uniref:hypothetical protein n=1 Tax=Streptomyces decoyicus TaxID=249567 RepID=UPI00363A1169